MAVYDEWLEGLAGTAGWPARFSRCRHPTSLSYLWGAFRHFDPLFHDKNVAHIVLVRTHGLAGVSALCLGLPAFLGWTRRRKFHSWIGRLYAVSVFLAAGTALPMALMAEGGGALAWPSFCKGVSGCSA